MTESVPSRIERKRNPGGHEFGEIFLQRAGIIMASAGRRGYPERFSLGG